MRLEDKVAVVTGGGAGIGEAICHRLADEGARVAALDISLPAAQQVIKAIGDGLAAEVDVSDSAAVDAAFAYVERDLGPVDILVNNAGAVGLDHVRRVSPRLARQRAEMAAVGRVETPLDALVRLSDEEWRQLMAVHLDGTFYCTRAAVRSMAARGTGVIVNMASICGIEGCTGHPHYSAAKAGILGLHQVGREGADRPGHPRQRGGAGFRRHQPPQGRAERGPTGGGGPYAGRAAGDTGRDRGDGRVPGLGRCRLLRRGHAVSQRRARHGRLTSSLP